MNRFKTIGPITLIHGDNQARFPFCNSLYISDAGLIIDPSSSLQSIEELYRSGGISNVCVSHWHEDHSQFLHKLDDLPLWMSEKDAVPLSDIDVFLEWYGLSSTQHVDLREQIRYKMEHQLFFRPRFPEKILSDGEVIDLGGASMEVLEAPGHSPGHLCFFFREPSILFLGDYTLEPFGPWYGDPYSDPEQTVQSLKRLKNVPADILVPGHGSRILRGVSGKVWDAYIDVVFKREAKIADYLSKQPRSLAEITDQWFILGNPREPLEYSRLGEQAHVINHLEWLERKGMVVYENSLYHGI